MSDLPLYEDKTQLDHIYAEIEQRVQAAREAQPLWPCQAGCDACCRRLAQVPEITAAEWHTLYAGLQQLPVKTQEAIGQKIMALAERDETAEPFVVCPFLNKEKGQCRVYEHRPAACRMYGYYVAKHNNQWCGLVEELSQAGELDEVMLGNYAATKRELGKQFGETRSLVDWYQQELHLDR